MQQELHSSRSSSRHAQPTCTPRHTCAGGKSWTLDLHLHQTCNSRQQAATATSLDLDAKLPRCDAAPVMSSNNSTLSGCNSWKPGSSSASSSMQASSQQYDSLLVHNNLTVNNSLGRVDSAG
uniref:Uncharacterized protein n=1 Tax=Tetradesmus obliquus TaxID=3088 RepID=A0A383W1E5_TETOB|eukprot:jgi/Sobl393_1/19252/SZX70923.1